MEVIGVGLIFLGLLVAFVGGIMILIAAFKESVLWGLGCLLVPFVSLIFVIMHWSEAKTGFLLNIGGTVIMVLGTVLGGSVPGS